MAATESEETVVAAPDAGAMLHRAGAPWLAPLRERLAAMQDRARLPHGILLSGPQGTGQVELAAWIAARLFCRKPGPDACGNCPDCRLLLAGNHPDLHWIAVAPGKKDISIEQIRSLSAALSLRSFRGGAKVAVIAAAEAMNKHSFNALLKTLEEPPGDTYLLLATSRIDKIPRTIASRCLRLSLLLPAEHAALQWLARTAARKDWSRLLALARGAAFLAEDYAAQGLEGIDRDMRELVAAAMEGQLDLVTAADRCAREAPAPRLDWLESWLTQSLKEAALASDLVNNNRLPWLRPPGADRKIRAGFGLLDQLREARRMVGGPLNMQLVFEGLLASLTNLLGPQAGPAEG